MQKSHFVKKLAELDKAYNNIVPVWRELAEYFEPRTSKFLVQDVNKKPKFSSKIKDSSPAMAVRNFSSGMMSGATSPAQKWFKTSVGNFQKPSYSVKSWCAVTGDLFRDIFSSSNIYQNFPRVYEQLGIFGISAMCLEKDFSTVMRTKVLPIGSYRIAKDFTGKVDTLYRVYTETAQNLVEEFGEENCSERVRTAAEENGETLIEIVHAVEKNRDADGVGKFAKKKKFISVYFERCGEDEMFLRESGFDAFPYVVFEADVNGEDVYPSKCPGIIALPNVKQLMAMIIKKAKAVDKMVDPALKGSATLKNKQVSNNPNTFVPIPDTATNGLSAIHEVNPQVLQLSNDIEALKATIGQIFYNDLFAMLVNSNYTQPRSATEIQERQQEKMVLLSPLLEQIITALKQIMEWLFLTSIELEILPEPPEEIQGSEFKIEFVSTLAQAQKAGRIGGIERFVTFVSNLGATVDPSAVMKLNVPEIIDDYAEYANIEPVQIVPNEIVAAQKAAAAKQKQQEQVMQNLQQGSEIVNNMGGVDAFGANLDKRIGI